jgi:hypothetical protein
MEMSSLPPWSLYTWRKGYRCPLNRRLGGLYSRSGRFEKEKMAYLI